MDADWTVLGIDPGSHRAGYARVTFRGARVIDLELGTWTARPGGGRAEALARLSDLASTFLAAHPIDAAAIEALFHHKNARSAFALAEARGALLAALGRAGVPVGEYPPATVKSTVGGFGAAAKDDLRRALALTVPGLADAGLERFGLDATDALAVAVTHHVHARRAALERRAVRR